MRNSDPITYKGVQYASAYIEMGGGIGCIRVATGSLLKVLEKDGLYSENVPREVEAVDEQIAYYPTDEEFRLPVKDVKQIIRLAYDEEEPTTHFEEKTIQELKQGEFFRLKKRLALRYGYVTNTSLNLKNTVPISLTISITNIILKVLQKFMLASLPNKIEDVHLDILDDY